jgi:DNA polymerase-3 subunit delta'
MISDTPPLQAPDHNFDTIVGQDLVKRFLIRSIELDRLPRALLFTGPDGVGKRSLMYSLTKRLVTQDLEPGSEKHKRALGKIQRGVHPDVLIVQPGSASGQIRREQIEELHDRAHFAPLESPVRVILIHPVEAMNQAAANTLLKILEEPPPALRLITGCRQIHQVLTTIRSRCAILRCPPVELEVITQWLMDKAGCLRRRAETAAQLSGGRPGIAWELLSGEDEKKRRNMCRELEFFRKQGYPSIFRVASGMLAGGQKPDEAMNGLLLWFRDLLIARLTARESRPGPEISESDLNVGLLINRDLLDKISETVGVHSPAGLAAAIEKILQRQSFAYSPVVDSNLLLEVLLTDVGVALKST